MALRTRIAIFLRVSALWLGGVLLAASPACAQQFRFPWDPPQRRHAEPSRLSASAIRDILASDGVQMVGPPQMRGDQAIAIGRDDDGRRMKYILDAASGEILRVVAVGPSERERRRDEERRRIETLDLNPPGEPLPPPEHAAPAGDDNLAGGAPPVSAPPVSPPPTSAPPAPAAPLSASPAPAPAPTPAVAAPPTVEARKPEPADASLSPIRPLRPAGAPRVEPLPQ
jgi:hypothetical protein